VKSGLNIFANISRRLFDRRVGIINPEDLGARPMASFVFKLKKKILSKTTFTRRLFFLSADILLISFSIYASLWLRFSGQIPLHYKKSLFYYILLALLIKLIFLIAFGLYNIFWRFFGLRDLIRLAYSLTLSFLFLGMMLFLLRGYVPFKAFPRSILISDYVLSLVLLGSLRISKRVYLEGLKGTLKLDKEKSRVLIIGAGNAGEQIVREMLRNKNSSYLPIGFIDDDPAKQGINIHGIKVLGKREDIPPNIHESRVDEVLIAIPSASSKQIKEIVEIIRNSSAIEKIRILPSIADLLDGKVTITDIHEISLDDLLGRDKREVDSKAIQEFTHDKRVLITGAAGSIGFEIVKAVLQFEPKTLVLLDNDDTEIFNLLGRLRSSEDKIIPVIGDVRDEAKIRSVFNKYAPQIVMHSAAYKHVPLMESFPEEAVKTNVLGTKILAEVSLKSGVEKFVLISTDKAINPVSVMGATKRVGEELLKALNTKNKTKFISVRFGNVLGSRGSVIPVFHEQIKRGGPVVVTHPEMKRYFMSISEAVLLVLEAAASGLGGEVFVLDMGEPIKIVDLAKEMIRLSGHEPDIDIPIVFSKVRPGEKIFEELFGTEEDVEPTAYKKILKIKDTKRRDPAFILEKIDDLIQISYQEDNKVKIIQVLREIIPTYRPVDKDSSWVID
jgi:FlaA1/EpsC-like NDP-sugar epimerase